jgi:hypothetical protein
MSTVYRELYRVQAPDGLRFITVEECDGLFRFVAWKLITEQEYDGQTRTHPNPIRWSGLYASAEDAERDARSEFPWLAQRNSN